MCGLRAASTDVGREVRPPQLAGLFDSQSSTPTIGKLHTLRGIHATALLDAGMPVDLVAQRLGDDPAVLLRNYTKRKRSPAAKERFASTLTALAAGFLKP